MKRLILLISAILLFAFSAAAAPVPTVPANERAPHRARLLQVKQKNRRHRTHHRRRHRQHHHHRTA